MKTKSIIAACSAFALIFSGTLGLYTSAETEKNEYELYGVYPDDFTAEEIEEIESTGVLKVVKGDSDTNGVVTSADLVSMISYIVKMENMSVKQLMSSDINNDRIVNVIDVILLKKMFMEDSSEDKSEAYETIEFGGYTWRVLEKNEDSMLMITEEVIESIEYNEKNESVTWETCTLRNYLNNEFYNSFSESDRARIKETNVINDDNPTYGTPGGNNTTDKIFLLSIDEANRLFSSDADRVARLSTEGAEKLGKPDYAGDNWWWWLRSPGYDSSRAAVGFYYGIVNNNGMSVGYSTGGGMRPALNLKY